MEEKYTMLKGHISIELTNHETGEVQRIEKDNMITNALNYIIPNWVGAGAQVNGAIMPLHQKALGGVMLFDTPLTENADNIFFPSEAHLVASAGQVQNSSNPMKGSKNVSESKATATGYQTVWDFNTSQANGTIQSIALGMVGTSEDMQPFQGIAFDRGAIHYIRRLNGDTSNQCTPLVYDVKEQCLYYIGITEGTSYTSDYDSNQRKYTYTWNATIYKEYLPTSLYKVADSANGFNYPEVFTTVSFETETNIETSGGSDQPWYYFTTGYDGYAYIIYVPRNTEGDGVFHYRTMKLDDLSFEISERKTVTVKSCSLYGGWSESIINNGIAYLTGYDRRWIYAVDLKNPVNVRSIDLGADVIKETVRFCNYRNGIVRVVLRENGATAGRYNWYEALIYPDGWVVKNGSYREGTSFGWNSNAGYPYRFISDNLMIWGNDYSSGYWGYGYLYSNYLGTICNLSSPIVKTAASSMKVTYTLTDIIDEEGEEE